MASHVVVCPKCGAVIRVDEAMFDQLTGEPCFTCPLAVLESCLRPRVIRCPKCGTVIEIRP